MLKVMRLRMPMTQKVTRRFPQPRYREQNQQIDQFSKRSVIFTCIFSPDDIVLFPVIICWTQTAKNGSYSNAYLNG